jgi:hypothetical protein
MNIDAAKGRNASGAITKKRFVKIDAAAADGESVKQCDTQGENAWGVSLFSVSLAEIARGKGASVINDGRAIVEAGATVANAAPVMSAADGRAITATSGNFILGYVDENGGGSAGDELGISLALAGAKVP